jgi:hypothetical protein
MRKKIIGIIICVIITISSIPLAGGIKQKKEKRYPQKKLFFNFI